MRRISILILGLTLSAAMLSAKAKYVFYWLTCKVPCLSYPKIL